jgi:hypothetical protein
LRLRETRNQRHYLKKLFIFVVKAMCFIEIEINENSQMGTTKKKRSTRIKIAKI